MNETIKLESNEVLELGMGYVTIKKLGTNPITVDLGRQVGTVGRRSKFDPSGFRKGSEVLFTLPLISTLGKEMLLASFFSTREEYNEVSTHFFWIEHKREHARTFWKRRPLFITTTLLDGTWRDPGLKEKGLTFLGIVTMDSDAIRIEKDLSFFDRIISKIRGWKL
jgi:hypothetical protein